jgi:ribonuclease HI
MLVPEIQVYFDGLCQPYNPGGIACYGYVILAEGQQYSGYGLAAEPFTDNATNNLAEYTGIIKALEWLLTNSYNNQKITVRGDSRLVINQINGKWKVKTITIIPLYQKAKSLIPEFKDIQIEWVPRDKNKEADILSNRAYQEVLENDPKLLQKSIQHMATEQQLSLLKNLGIAPERYLSKIEAKRLISKATKNQGSEEEIIKTKFRQ